MGAFSAEKTHPDSSKLSSDPVRLWRMRFAMAEPAFLIPSYSPDMLLPLGSLRTEVAFDLLLLRSPDFGEVRLDLPDAPLPAVEGVADDSGG